MNRISFLNRGNAFNCLVAVYEQPSQQCKIDLSTTTKIPEVCKKNRIHHGWSVEIGKSQPEGPSVPVGNEARRVSHWNDGPEG